MKVFRPYSGSWSGVLVDFDGILQDQRGRPVPNAVMRFYHETFGYLGEVVTARGPVPGTPPERSTEPERGFFSRPHLPAGNYTIDILTIHQPRVGLPPVADAPAVPMSTIELRLDMGSPFDSSPYEIEPLRVEFAVATVCGVLVDEAQDGAPLPGVAVHLYRDGECLDELTGVTVTDQEGRFFVPDQPIGQYMIRVERGDQFLHSHSFIHDGELLMPHTLISVRV